MNKNCSAGDFKCKHPLCFRLTKLDYCYFCEKKFLYKQSRCECKQFCFKCDPVRWKMYVTEDESFRVFMDYCGLPLVNVNRKTFNYLEPILKESLYYGSKGISEKVVSKGNYHDAIYFPEKVERNPVPLYEDQGKYPPRAQFFDEQIPSELLAIRPKKRKPNYFAMYNSMFAISNNLI